MAKITQRINKSIESGARSVVWDTAKDVNDDGTAIAVGDIFRIEDSLYRPGKSLSLTANSAGSCSIRLNSVVTVYPRRNAGDFVLAEHYDLVASGREFTETSQPAIIVQPDETFTLSKGEVNIYTVEIVTLSGEFRLVVT